VQWLRCYALSIENAGGNNDTKCLYFPFGLDQAPLTWLESLEKYSIDKWDQLKEQFTSNFTGAMGCSGTRMDLAMVKQEQGETLLLTVYFGTHRMFITLWFGFDYGTNPPLGTLII
jgi:hypothetical protein